jgi:hypothetical protein
MANCIANQKQIQFVVELYLSKKGQGIEAQKSESRAQALAHTFVLSWAHLQPTARPTSTSSWQRPS